MWSVNITRFNKEKFGKTFCVLPWVHSFINLGGEHQVCCTGEEFDNYILDDNNKRMNVLDNKSVDDVMNSQYMKDFRLKLLAGEFPNACTRCAVTEESEGISRRCIENDEYSGLIDDLVQDTKDDGEITPRVVHSDYRLGNICNLQCRMCNPVATRKWIKDYRILSDDILPEDFLENIDNYKTNSWLDSSILLDDFRDKLPTMTRLHFGGGEPLYNPKMLEMLQICIEMGYAQQVTISYNTNLTILNDKILDIWKQFKSIKLLVSIDGFGELNDYIRSPSKWKIIDENLKYLDVHHADYNIDEIIVSTTVQMNNILHLDKLFNYLGDFNFVEKCPNLIALYFPQQLSFFILPKPLVYVAKLKIDSILERIKTQEGIQEFMIQNLRQIRNSLNVRQSDDAHLLQKFFKFSREYDEIHGLDMLKVNPEFEKFVSQE